MRPAFELAQILEQHWPQVEQSASINSWQLRTLSALKQCRTSSLGGHVDACTQCGLTRICYNSCRNRHCPKCQNREREEWMLSRENGPADDVSIGSGTLTRAVFPCGVHPAR